MIKKLLLSLILLVLIASPLRATIYREPVTSDLNNGKTYQLYGYAKSRKKLYKWYVIEHDGYGLWHCYTWFKNDAKRIRIEMINAGAEEVYLTNKKIENDAFWSYYFSEFQIANVHFYIKTLDIENLITSIPSFAGFR